MKKKSDIKVNYVVHNVVGFGYCSCMCGCNTLTEAIETLILMSGDLVAWNITENDRIIAGK